MLLGRGAVVVKFQEVALVPEPATRGIAIGAWFPSTIDQQTEYFALPLLPLTPAPVLSTTRPFTVTVVCAEAGRDVSAIVNAAKIRNEESVLKKCFTLENFSFCRNPECKGRAWANADTCNGSCLVHSVRLG